MQDLNEKNIEGAKNALFSFHQELTTNFLNIENYCVGCGLYFNKPLETINSLNYSCKACWEENV